ncbi:hypothetical protein VP01_293g10 [Puccinia sorghi]|uniref:Uncharacterized protein n=1 Tax=Puccinia sorghi TaxID=27349 RepID=A0A0L6V112_9BASI|nr:hypothetical protein VP01_293g10 [Puccinia sorghi]
MVSQSCEDETEVENSHDDRIRQCRESSSEAQESGVINCFVCNVSLATYGPLGCLHRTLCKRCAMKQATGGKCKVNGD